MGVRTKVGILSIASSAAVGQALAFVAAPVLTRLYTPEAFGIFGVSAALTLVIGTVAALRLDFAIVLPHEKEETDSLVAFGLAAATSLALLASALVLSLGSILYGDADWLPSVQLVPLGAWAMGAYLLMNQYALRERRYAAVARRNLIQAGGTVVLQLALANTFLRDVGLTLGLVIGYALGAVSLFVGSGVTIRRLRASMERGRLRPVLQRYKRFPLQFAPAGLLTVGNQMFPMFMVAAVFGAREAGYFALAQRVLALPVATLGVAIGQTYLAEASGEVREGKNPKRLFLRVSATLFVIASTIPLAIIPAGQHVFSVVFGPTWATSGQYAASISIAIAAQLVASPVSQTLTILERGGLQLSWEALRSLLLAIVFYACMSTGASASATVFWLSLLLASLYLALWVMSFASLRRYFERAASVVD